MKSILLLTFSIQIRMDQSVAELRIVNEYQKLFMETSFDHPKIETGKLYAERKESTKAQREKFSVHLRANQTIKPQHVLESKFRLV